MTTIQEMLKGLADRYPEPELQPIHQATPFPKCGRCYEFDVANVGDICEQCQRETRQGYEVLQMLGRLANGAERDHGKVFHAVMFGSYKAVCGAQPGRRSVGWTFDPRGHGKEVTCPRCLKKLEKISNA